MPKVPQSKPKQSAVDTDDSRFKDMHTGATFGSKKSDSHKVKLDSRFEGVLTDSRFRNAPGQVDRYGRKNKKSGEKAASKELEQFYEIDKPEDEPSKGRKVKPSSSKIPSDSGMDRMEYINKLSRGEISDSSSDSSEGSDDDEDSGTSSDDEEEFNRRELETKKRSVLDIPLVNEESEEIPTGESSRRLAILHCDWDHIKAEDLVVVLQSFCPAGGTVQRVTVYPSDFGLERMEAEAKFGPQSIWAKVKHAQKESDSDASSEDHYNGINGSEDDRTSSDEEEDAGDEIPQNKSRATKGADFKRKKDAVGLVLQEELVRRGKADPKTLTEDFNSAKKDAAAEAAVEGGIDELALRDYELTKLKYYFAIAELDSVATSEAVYTELDGVELEHSAMTFDLRFVPDDADFAERKVRDCSTSAALSAYKPPDFLVNALQHTTVKCTWDQEDTGSNRKQGTTLAQWKDLAESDMQQFLASGSESEGEEEEVDVTKSKKSAKKGKEKAGLRMLLLGDDAGSDMDDDTRAVEDDDFFVHPDSDNEGASDSAEKEDKVFTYISKSSDPKDATHAGNDETPFEKLQRKLAEKKKQRKLAKKEAQKSDASAGARQKSLDKSQASKGKGKDKGKGKGDDEGAGAGAGAGVGELELMFGGDHEDGYDMRALQKLEKLRNKGLDGKRHKKRVQEAEAETKGMQENFKVDVKDARFSRLLKGDSAFGIDPMSSEFKETKGMRDILHAQRKRRKVEGKNESSNTEKSGSGEVDIAALKNRFIKHASKKM